ncbi:hypothetical protein JHK84_057350 (mitochondrion) [Glycine max]|nr:hypothetical protein JHK86_057243 [Glycine max]KAG4906020.1 hypothetical protein JHK86_057267 [Glycine max]KAG4934593.1 hypothetical protein JHK85_049512 [Glycine max]KAG4936282.1 hypothetical protein JHK85_051201 [Glycine max]KAG4936299.1 hypothetical protein JHK85_051218 [Glycine max]
MLGQGKPQESIGWLPAPSRPASCSRGGGAVKVGEEHCFEGGKAWLTSHFEEATGVLSSNDAYGLSHSHPKWWPDSAWPGREEIHIETFAIREYLSMLASVGGLSYDSPAAASYRPSRLILIWLYLYVASHERFQRPSLDKKQNAPSPTALSSAGDFHEMKTGGIVVCSTLVALVYIPEYSYGRSVTQPTQKSKGLTPSRLENDPYGMA